LWWKIMAARWGIDLWDQKPLIQQHVEEGIAAVDKVLFPTCECLFLLSACPCGFN
jgi:hypothetical protein